MNKNNVFIATLLILFGVSLLLIRYDFVGAEVFLVACGGAFLASYGSNKGAFNLLIGVFLVGLGLDNILNLSISSSFILLILGGLFYLLYFTKKGNGFIYPGMILAVIGINQLLEEWTTLPSNGLFFILLGFGFMTTYFFEKERMQSNRLLGAGLIILLIGVSLFIASTIMTPQVENLLRIGAVPALFVFIGFYLLFQPGKKKKKEEDDENLSFSQEFPQEEVAPEEAVEEKIKPEKKKKTKIHYATKEIHREDK
ncbi:hypothetical protein SANA_05800 [Gottschalkiaceae bacterium SANA]|nr:hypothetical protein SANA_05800 [Gottschalkiaceae bacterium SANA]